VGYFFPYSGTIDFSASIPPRGIRQSVSMLLSRCKSIRFVGRSQDTRFPSELRRRRAMEMMEYRDYTFAVIQHVEHGRAEQTTFATTEHNTSKFTLFYERFLSLSLHYSRNTSGDRMGCGGVDTSKTSHVIIRIQGHGIFGKEM